MQRDDAEEYTEALGQIVAGGWRQVALGERLGVPAALGISTREWVEDRLGGYVRLSLPERREAVAELTEEGMSTRKIGDVLGVDQSTVVRDASASASPPARPEPAPPKQSADADTSPRTGSAIVDAADDRAVREARAAREFAAAVAAAAQLRPQLAHVVQSALAADRDRALERAETALDTWRQIVDGLAASHKLRRVQ